MTREQLVGELNKYSDQLTELRSAETIDTDAVLDTSALLRSVQDQISALDIVAAPTPVIVSGETINGSRRATTLAGKILASDFAERARTGTLGSLGMTIDVSDVRDALDIFTDPSSSGYSDIVPYDYVEGIALKPVAPLTLLNYIPQSNTTSDQVVVFVETGFTDGTAPVASRSGSPADYASYAESGITFTKTIVQVVKVGTVFRTDTSTLADQAQLSSIIENRLVYQIKNNLIAELVANSDTPDGLSSLIVTGSGRAQSLTYTITGTVETDRQNAANAVRQAVTKVQKTYTPAAYILASAEFLEALSLAVSSVGTYLYANPNNDTNVMTLWGLPVVWCPQLNISDDSDWGGIVVGSSQFISLVNRQQITLAASENVGTDFVQDAVRIKGSIRVALTNVRPEAFCVVTGVSAS